MPVITMWELTRFWYGDRLEPDYRPKATETLQSLLTNAGLIGDFWQLG